MKCRLCGCEENQVVRAANVFGGTIKHKFWECGSCGVVYLYPFLSPEEEKYFYEQEFEKFMSKRALKERDWGSAVDHIRTNQDQVVRRWKFLEKYLYEKKNITPSAKLLEIGCSSGFMLESFRNYGIDCFGVEPSGKFLDFLKDNNFDAYSSLDELIIFNPNIKFDIITHFFVFEHIADPFDFINKTYNLLSDNGVIIAEIPSCTDALTSIYTIPEFEKFYWSIAHHYYYNPHSIKYIMSRLGLKYEIFPEQRYDLSNHITWLMDGKPGGQNRFKFISQETNKSYMDDLKSNWNCDTIILVIKK